MTRPSCPREPVRIVRIIARLNTGGPAIQAITLTQRFSHHGYQTTLVRGREELDEGNMDHLAKALGVRPVLIPWLRRNPGLHDLPALVSLIRIIRRERPQIVHTHAAKAGTLGRLAALIAGLGRRPRPVLIHTFHGHSLSGYFAPRTAAVYRSIERVLARFSHRLIAVSDEVRDELVAMGVAPASKFDVVQLGFDLSTFTLRGPARTEAREALRAELGIPSNARVVTLVARLVPIKRVDRFLRVANALRDLEGIRFLIVGDGELRHPLQSSPEAHALGERLIWAGLRRNMAAVYFASDVVMQTSDNEGTPVALIEARAAGVPVVSTLVGGTQSAVKGAGFLAPVDDEARLARSVRSLLADPTLRSQASASEGDGPLSQFDLCRLVSDLDDLYTRARASAPCRGLTTNALIERYGYIGRNLLLNAIAPALLPISRQRGSLGMDNDADAIEDTLRRLQPSIDALGGWVGRDVLELGTGRSPGLLKEIIAAGARSGIGIDPQLAITDRGPARFLRFDGRNIPLPSASIDVIVSKSVLEHVKPQDVEPLISETFRLLRPGGGGVHIIDLRDHMFISGDNKVTGDWLDALRYPEPLFRAMFANRSTAINRLREPDWQAIFDRHGFEISSWEQETFPLPVNFDRARLHARFRDIPPEVLAVGYLTIAVRRPL